MIQAARLASRLPWPTVRLPARPHLLSRPPSPLNGRHLCTFHKVPYRAAGLVEPHRAFTHAILHLLLVILSIVTPITTISCAPYLSLAFPTQFGKYMIHLPGVTVFSQTMQDADEVAHQYDDVIVESTANTIAVYHLFEYREAFSDSYVDTPCRKVFEVRIDALSIASSQKTISGYIECRDRGIWARREGRGRVALDGEDREIIRVLRND